MEVEGRGDLLPHDIHIYQVLDVVLIERLEQLLLPRRELVALLKKRYHVELADGRGLHVQARVRDVHR